MMKELSMHILDIVENSIRAKSPCVTLEINEDAVHNRLSFSIIDKGTGMPSDMVKVIKDPFTTSRTTRKVGLGIPLLSQTCLQCGGCLDIESELGEGTKITATMQYDNIDRPPLGDIVNTVHVLVIMRPEVDFKYIHKYNGNEYVLDTTEIKEVLEGVPFSEPSVMQWLKEDIQNGIEEIYQRNE